MNTLSFETRAQFVVAVSDPGSVVYAAPNGTVVHADRFTYRRRTSTNPPPISDLPGWEPLNVTWVEHFGAQTVQAMWQAEASTFDASPAVQAAIDYQSSRDGGDVRMSDGYYRLESTITINREGIRLIGNDSNSTKLYAAHTSGPVLHIMEGSCGLERIALLASVARQQSSDITNVGIRVQVEDIASSPGRLKNTSMADVRVGWQPSHGIVISGAFTGTLTRLWVLYNGGQGIAVDRGFAYPMTHKEDTAGLCSFNECQIVGNAGHGLAFGHPDDVFTTQALRMFVNNCEIAKNATSETTRYEHAQVYCRACEVTFMANVFKPTPGSASAGLYIAGRCITVTNNRFIDVGHVALIGSYDIFPTIGVYITGFNVISSPSMTSAVRLTTTNGQTSEPSGISVHNYNNTGGVDTLVDTTMGGSSSSPLGRWRAANTDVRGASTMLYKRSDQSMAGTTYVNDDDLKFWVMPGETVSFLLVLEYAGPPASDFEVTVFTPSDLTCRFSSQNGIRVTNGDTVLRTHVMSPGEGILLGSTTSNHRIGTIRGIVTDVTTAGLIQVAWRQFKPDLNNQPVVVYAGLSMLELHHLVK